MRLAAGEHQVTSNGVDLRVRVAGLSRADGPVLLIQPPGWGAGADLYEATLQPLEQEFTVVYLDPIGSGGSQAPENPDDVNVGTMVEDIESLRNFLGLEKLALLGHSHGGYVALNYALKYAGHLSHLIVVDAQLGVTEPREDVQRNLPALMADARFAEAAAVFAAPWALDTDEDLNRFLCDIMPLYFSDPQSAAVTRIRAEIRKTRISASAMKSTTASNDRFLIRDRLDEIDVAALVLVGRQDFICSLAQSSVIHRALRQSRMTVFERSGHFPWLEEPEPFFAAIGEFLRS